MTDNYFRKIREFYDCSHPDRGLTPLHTGRLSLYARSLFQRLTLRSTFPDLTDKDEITVLSVVPLLYRYRFADLQHGRADQTANGTLAR